MLAVSSNQSVTGTGIVWATVDPGVLHAYDATDLTHELWNSNQNATRDNLGQFSRYGQIVVADGQVFVPTFSDAVVSYGLNPPTPVLPSVWIDAPAANATLVGTTIISGWALENTSSVGPAAMKSQ